MHHAYSYWIQSNANAMYCTAINQSTNHMSTFHRDIQWIVIDCWMHLLHTTMYAHRLPIPSTILSLLLYYRIFIHHFPHHLTIIITKSIHHTSITINNDHLPFSTHHNLSLVSVINVCHNIIPYSLLHQFITHTIHAYRPYRYHQSIYQLSFISCRCLVN